MKKFIKWFLIIFVVIALFGGDSDNASVDNDTEQVKQVEQVEEVEEVEEVEQAEEVEEAIIVDATTLINDYENNEVKADKEYKDKLIEVTGKVGSIGVSFGSTYVCLDSDGDFSITSVQCFIDDEDEINKIAELNEGDVVTLIGVCDGMSMNIGVDDCKLK